jgi:hypothetical protein
MKKLVLLLALIAFPACADDAQPKAQTYEELKKENADLRAQIGYLTVLRDELAFQRDHYRTELDNLSAAVDAQKKAEAAAIQQMTKKRPAP